MAEAINLSGALIDIENSDLNNKKIQVDVVFKGPVFLESQANLRQNKLQDKNRFDIYCGDNPKPSICCAVIAL